MCSGRKALAWGARGVVMEGMEKVTNLRQARKAQDRIKKAAQATENAVFHGRSKAQRLLEASQSEGARRMLDQHRLEDDSDENAGT